MDDRIAEMSLDEFTTYMSIGVFTEDEIAEKIRSYKGSHVKVRLQLLQAVQKMTGGGPIKGPIRTALRYLSELPPVPGD